MKPDPGGRETLRHRAADSVAVAGAAGVVVFVAMWELVVRLLDVQDFILLAPSEIADTLADTPRFYLDHSLVTARHALLALAISLVVAIVLGSLLAASAFLERAAQPVLVVILVAPWVAYISSVVVWLGGGDRPVLFIAALVTMPAFTFSVVTGLRSADPAIRDVLATAGASRIETLWRVRIPSAVPFVTTAARFNIGLALAASYFSEGGNLGNDGLGAIGKQAQSFNNGRVLWSSVVCTATLGIVLLMLLSVFERTALRWHASRRT